MSDSFLASWRIAQKSDAKLHKNLPEASFDFPHTIATVLRLREMIDGFMELPKDKRPPEASWFKPDEVEEWLDRAFSHDKQTEFKFQIEDVEG